MQQAARERLAQELAEAHTAVQAAAQAVQVANTKRARAARERLADAAAQAAIRSERERLAQAAQPQVEPHVEPERKGRKRSELELLKAAQGNMFKKVRSEKSGGYLFNHSKYFNYCF